MTARYIVADVFDGLATLPDDSVDLVFGSPPFLALRSYLPAEHESKHLEIGSEATPADFLDTLLDVVEACDRVLAPHGSLVFELGDTFAGSGGAGGDYNPGGLRDGQNGFTGSQSRSGWHRLGARADQDDQPPNYRKDGTSTESGSPGGGLGWPLPKSLCGIPTLFAWSLAYGRNLLRPERVLLGPDKCKDCGGTGLGEAWSCETCDGQGRMSTRWRIRNLIVWARPNPPVGALGDKFRPATSYLTVACKSDKRWFDLDAVRQPHTTDPAARTRQGPRDVPQVQSEGTGRRDALGTPTKTGFVNEGNPAGAPPLDYWEIPTQPYAGSHYATFPARLVEKPVEAMCPRRVCQICGEPSRRIVGDAEYLLARTGEPLGEQPWESGGVETGNRKGVTGRDNGAVRQAPTLGWTDCGCKRLGPLDCVSTKWRNGVVLDPFAGSGTTLAVATGHGRDAIGIDLDARNFELARERVGPMFLPEPEFVGEPFQFPKVEDVQTEVL